MTKECGTGVPDWKENKGPLVWPKFEMSTCKAWTGHIHESLLGVRDIVIGWLFFIWD